MSRSFNLKDFWIFRIYNRYRKCFLDISASIAHSVFIQGKMIQRIP